MKEYYIHLNDQQAGPYSIEKIIELKISKETMVWFEGAEKWEKAEDINELKTIFKVVPPPFTKLDTNTPPPLNKKDIPLSKGKENEQKSNSKKAFIIVGVVIAIIITIFLINNNINQNRYLEQQLEVQRQAIEEQQSIEKQRRLEVEEKQKEEKRQKEIDKEIQNINNKLEDVYAALAIANQELNTAMEFQLFRSSSDKKLQIANASRKVNDLEAKEKKLNNRLKQLR